MFDGGLILFVSINTTVYINNIKLTPRSFFAKAEEIQSFDKDRALTVLMYKTRRNAGAPWDDNVHSLRGLEEFVRKDGDKFQKRKRHIGTILKEQARLKSAAGVSDLANASRTMKKSPEELQSELLRGVSCSLSKTDKQRALSVAMKDEKASVIRTNSGRRLLGQFMTKINQWSSSRSLEEHPRSSRMLMANEGSSRNAKES